MDIKYKIIYFTDWSNQARFNWFNVFSCFFYHPLKICFSRLKVILVYLENFFICCILRPRHFFADWKSSTLVTKWSTTIQIRNSTATSLNSLTTNTATAKKLMTIKFNKMIKSTIYNKTNQKSQTKPTKTQPIPLTPRQCFSLERTILWRTTLRYTKYFLLWF